MIWKAAVIIALMLSILEAKPTWHKIVVDPQMNFRAVDFVDYEKGWVCGAKGDTSFISHSSDGGRVWLQQYSKAGSYIMNDIDFCDTMVGWTVGKIDLIPSFRLQLRTLDGGRQWTQTTPADNRIQGSWLNGCRLLSTTCGASAGGGFFYVERYGDIFYWQGGGWSFWYTNLCDAEMVDSSTIWAVGCTLSVNLGFICHTTDAGVSWHNQISGRDSLPTIRTLDFVNRGFGVAIGDNGLILKTINGGTVWSKQFVNDALARIAMVDTLQGWIVGARGAILHTTDGGNTWFHDSSGTTVNLSGVSFVDSTHGWAVGDSGVVLIYCDSLTGMEEDRPIQPDPQSISISPLSNPTRKPVFMYDLPYANSQATITIFDCLGKVVTQRRLMAPSHAGSFAWDRLDRAGQRVPAGVYFVRIVSGSSSGTAKVLLVR